MGSGVKFNKGENKLILTNGAVDRFDAQKRKLETLLGTTLTDEEASSRMLGGSLALEKND